MDEDTKTEHREGGSGQRRSGRRIARILLRIALWTLGFFLFVFSGAWLWFESSSADEVLARKAETILEEGLSRDVSIGDISLRPGLPAKLVARDLRLGNEAGFAQGDQATITRVELKLSLRSLLRGKVRIRDVVIIDPSFVLEVRSDGDGGLTTNLPKWTRASTEPRERADLGIDTVEVRNGTFELIDHAHNVGVVARKIEGEIEPDLRDLDDPRGEASLAFGAVHVRATRFEFPPIHVESRLRLENQVLWVETLHGEGSAMRIDATGPIRKDRMDLDATLRADLEKLRDTFELEAALAGVVDARARLAGPYTQFELDGTFDAPDLLFDVYNVDAVKGTFRRIEDGFEVVATEGSFGGGTVTARYSVLFGDEPTNVLEIRHKDVIVETLLGLWGIERTGLLARGTGDLLLGWADGPPEEGLSGSAVLRADPALKTSASFGAPVGGTVSYRLSGGKLYFEPLSLKFPALEGGATSIELEGSVGLKDETLNLNAMVQSQSFADVDRLWAGLARAFGQDDWELLGIAGRGTIAANVTGTTELPTVEIEVHADGFAFGDLHLERADGRVVFDGARKGLFFDGARFENGQGELVINEWIGLGGDELDLALDVVLHDWDAGSLIRFLELDFPVSGLATGRVAVHGAPSRGRVTFSPLEIRSATSTIKLSGDASWTPVEKGLAFDLDVGLTDVPFETVAGILDLGDDLPLSGDVTGTVHLQGPLTEVDGAGSIVLSRGVLLGEPVDSITSDLVVSEGVVRLKNLNIRMPAGFLKGEAKYDFAQDRFGYVVDGSEIDIEKLAGYPTIRSVLTGKLIVSSSGAGTMQEPEIVLKATVRDAVLLEVPVSEPGVNLYVTLRNGQFTVEGSVGDVLALDGSGSLDVDSGAIDGNVSLSVSNVASMLRRFEKRTGVKTGGSAELSLALSGALSPIEALVVDGRIDRIDLRVAEHTVRTTDSPRFSLKNGVFSLDSFNLLVDDQTFTAKGTVALATGALNLEANGLVGAGLLAVGMPDLRATGDIAIALDINGTLENPLVAGTAEIRQADIRIQGFPQALRDVRSTIVLSGNLIEIDSFSAKLGGGVVSAGGRIELEGGEPRRVRINTQGRNVDLRLSQGLTVEGGFDLVLAGDPAERMLLRGEAKLTRVLYTKDVEVGAAIVDFIVARRTRFDTLSEAWEARTSLDVQVDAKDAIRVRNNLASITGSAEVRISGTLAQPVMLGDAVIDEGGKLRISNVDYRVVSGSVSFQNPFRIDPYIDLTAEGRYQNEYDLTLSISGTPDALEMSVASDPPIADLSILNVFGIQTANTSGGISTRDAVEWAGGSIIDSGVGSLIGSRLAFADNLRLEGLTGSEPRVTIEKSISDDVRVIVTYTMNGAGENVEIIEWRVSPLFVIQATRDSTRDTTYFINAIDVSFSRRFGGQW